MRYYNKAKFDENIEMIKRLSMETGSVVAATGVVDIISNGTYTYIISNGCEMLSMITGTGCMLTGLIASYISSENILDGTVLAVALMGICGELLSMLRVLEASEMSLQIICLVFPMIL